MKKQKCAKCFFSLASILSVNVLKVCGSLRNIFDASNLLALVQMMFGFFIAVIVSNRYGLESYGHYILSISFVSIFLSISTFRVSEIIVRFFKDDVRIPKSLAFKLLVLDVVPFVSLVHLVTTLFSDKYEFIKHSYWAIMMFGMSEMIRGLVQGLYQAKSELTDTYFIFQSLSIFVGGVCVCFLAYFNVTTVYALLVIQSFISMLVSLFLAILYEIRLRELPVVKIAFLNFIFEIKGYLYRSWVGSIMKAGNNKIESPLVAILLDATSLGLYALVRQFMAPANILTAQLANKHAKIITEFGLKNEWPELKIFISEVNRNLKIPLLLLLSFGGVVSFLYTTLFVITDFSSFYLLIVLMVIAAYVYLGSRVWWTRAFSLAVDPNYSIVGNLIASLSLIIGVPVLVAFFGLSGVPLAQLTRQLIANKYFYGKIKN